MYFWFRSRPLEAGWRHVVGCLLLLGFICFSGRCRPVIVSCWSCLRISRCRSFGGFRVIPSLSFFPRIIVWKRKEFIQITWKMAHCPSSLVNSWSFWDCLLSASSSLSTSSSSHWSISPYCWVPAWGFRSYRRLEILFTSCWIISPLVFTSLALSTSMLIFSVMWALRHLRIYVILRSFDLWKHLGCNWDVGWGWCWHWWSAFSRL